MHHGLTENGLLRYAIKMKLIHLVKIRMYLQYSCKLFFPWKNGTFNNTRIPENISGFFYQMTFRRILRHLRITKQLAGPEYPI